MSNSKKPTSRSSLSKILIISPTMINSEHIKQLKKKCGPNFYVTPAKINFENLCDLLQFASPHHILAFIRAEDIPEGITDPSKNQKRVLVYDGEWKSYKEET